MQSYKFTIGVAILVFPIIAFLITLPYMIKQYHKYGSIPILRTIIIYSFTLYLLTAYFMVILPLPSISEVQAMTTKTVQLVPFKFIDELIIESKFVLNDFSTYLPALKQPVFYTNLFNIILTLPFGVYLRYYFKKKWWEVLLLSFLLSLFFELTQLSGLYGIYPRPYRLFDVDDLILNTIGGLLGYIITPLLIFALPSRKKLDEIAYERGKKVSFLRRMIAYIIDYVFFNLIILPFVLIFNIELDFSIYLILHLCYFLISVSFFKGRTFGKACVNLKIVDMNGKNAKVSQLLTRYTFRFVIYYKAWDIINWNRKFYSSEVITLITIIVCIALFIVHFQTFIDIITKKEQFVYEKVSKTKNISTISYQNENDSCIKEENIISKQEELCNIKEENN